MSLASGTQTQAVWDRRGTGRGRHGRSLSREGHAAGPHPCHQSSSCATLFWSHAQTAVRARSQDDFHSECMVRPL